MMEQSQDAQITRKGERTRRRIFETALDLFASKGYEETTMRDIAAQAECSLGLTYRYFARKEHLVLALYEHLARELEEQVRALPSAPLAERFYRAMRAHLALLEPYRHLFAAVVGAAMNPRSELGVLGESTTDVRRRAEEVFAVVVAGATDAPRAPQAGQLATLLYGAHMALVLFWLLDRTSGARAAHELLALAREILAGARRLLRVPPFAKLLARLARAIDAVLGHRAEGT